MTKSARSRWAVGIEVLLFAVLFILQYSGLSPLRFSGAAPALLLPALVTFSMFYAELPSAMCGLLVGIFADATASVGFCFHTILFFLLGFAVSFLLRYYFNNRLPTALLLGFLTGAATHLLRWLIFDAAHESGRAGALYLLRFSLPAILLSEIVLIPLYFLQRRLARWKESS